MAHRGALMIVERDLLHLRNDPSGEVTSVAQQQHHAQISKFSTGPIAHNDRGIFNIPMCMGLHTREDNRER